MDNNKNFSFVIPNMLAGMGLPGNKKLLRDDLEFLRQRNISAIVSLTESSLNKATLERYNIEYLHLSVKDVAAPSLKQIKIFTNYVDTMLQNQKVTVAHCYSGFGRTGTMLACYFVKEGMQYGEAIRQIRYFRPGSITAKFQEDAIRNYYLSIR